VTENTIDALADGPTTGHRMVLKISAVARAEGMVSSAVNGLPDRLDLVWAEDIAALERSVDSLNRQIDRLVEKAPV